MFSIIHPQKYLLSTLSNNIYSFSKIYKVPFNINREEHAPYLKKVVKAEKMLLEDQARDSKSILPRRKRRIFDKPRFDTNIENYAAWRLYRFQEIIQKPNDHCTPVILKIPLQPKWLIHAFGQGMLPYCHEKNVSRQFIFEDVNFSQYILYEFRQTTAHKPNIPGYDYEKQDHLRPGMRKKKRLDPEQFWNSQQFFEFRLNGTKYAQKMKFKTWLVKEIQERKNQPSYDSKIDKKFGQTHTFNHKRQSQLFIKHQPIVKYVTPESWQAKQESKDKKKKEKIKNQQSTETSKQQEGVITSVKFNFAKKLSQEYRVYSVEGKKQESKSSEQVL